LKISLKVVVSYYTHFPGIKQRQYVFLLGTAFLRGKMLIKKPKNLKKSEKSQENQAFSLIIDDFIRVY